MAVIPTSGMRQHLPIYELARRMENATNSELG